MRRGTRLYLTMLLIAAFGAPASAAKKAGVTMPDAITVDGKQLTLNGIGLREATLFKVDVYVAGLYVERTSSNPAHLIGSNELKRIVLRFVRDVDRGDILKAWHEGFKNNATAGPEAIRAQVAQLDSWMRDFKDGDTLTFTHVPGRGVQVDINNVPKGMIQGDDFAHSLFAIWLGARPPTGELRAGLLGKH